MTITHFKGFHFSFPFRFTYRKPKQIDAYVEFSENSKYNVDVDQSDWNKLFGVKWHFFKPREDAIMCGWRYVAETDSFDLCLYIHKNGSYDPYAKPLISVTSKAIIQIQFDEVAQKVRFLVCEHAHDETRTKVELDWTNFSSGYLINAWFGGNRTPNRQISFDLHIIWG